MSERLFAVRSLAIRFARLFDTLHQFVDGELGHGSDVGRRALQFDVWSDKINYPTL
jgi:hypothetical protein